MSIKVHCDDGKLHGGGQWPTDLSGLVPGPLALRSPLEVSFLTFDGGSRMTAKKEPAVRTERLNSWERGHIRRDTSGETLRGKPNTIHELSLGFGAAKNNE